MDTSKFATKSDIKDLQSKLKYIGGDILKVEERVENLEEGQQRIETKLDNLQNSIDKFVGIVDDLRTDNTIGTQQTRDLQIKIQYHEERLVHLESLKHSA